MKLVALLALAWVLGAPAGAAAATIGGFGVLPLGRSHSGYFIFHLVDGDVYRAHVEVDNGGPRPITLLVYGVDGLTGTTSGVVYGNRNQVVRRAGTWVTPEVSKIKLAAHSHRRIAFTVTVPPKAAPGDHVAGIAFEDAKPVTSRGRFQITEVIRAVVGIEIKLAGPAHKRLKLRALGIEALPGTNGAAVAVTLVNVGQLLCKPVLSVSVRGGGKTTTATRALDTMLPHDKIVYPFDWRQALAPGRYKLRARATRCGRKAVIHGTAVVAQRLAKPGPSTSVRASAPAVSSSGVDWWLLLIVGAGGLALGSAGVLLARRGRIARSGS